MSDFEGVKLPKVPETPEITAEFLTNKEDLAEEDLQKHLQKPAALLSKIVTKDLLDARIVEIFVNEFQNAKKHTDVSRIYKQLHDLVRNTDTSPKHTQSDMK